MKIRLAEAARDDLRRIIRTIAASDPERASGINNELLVAIRAIAAAPRLCPIVQGSRSPGVRKKALRPHLILFHVRPDGIMLLRILHQRSDWAALA